MYLKHVLKSYFVIYFGHFGAKNEKRGKNGVFMFLNVSCNKSSAHKSLKERGSYKMESVDFQKSRRGSSGVIGDNKGDFVRYFAKYGIGLLSTP